MRHKSFHEYIFLVSANDVMEHFAFPGNIDFADDDQGFDRCVYSSSVKPQAAQAHYLWVWASEVIQSEYTRIISVLSDAK